MKRSNNLSKCLQQAFSLLPKNGFLKLMIFLPNCFLVFANQKESLIWTIGQAA